MKNPNGRRWSAVLLVLIFALSLVLAGCHEEPQEPESDVSAAATTTAPEESTEPSGSEPAETTEPSASVTPDDPASSGGTKAPVKPGGTSTQRPLGTTAVTKANGTTKPDGTTAPTSPATTGRTTRKPGEATNGYIQPQFFISTFKALPHSTGASLETFKKIVRLNKEAGINLIENAIMSRAEGLQAFEACEAEGMRFLAQNITADKGYSGMGGNIHPFDDALIKATVEELAKYKYLEGYYTWDEVPRDQFDTARRLNDLFKKHDRSALAFALILPSYGTYRWTAPDGNWRNAIYAQYVNEYVEKVSPDVLSFDYYPFQQHGGENTNLTNCPMWRDMGLMRQKSLETGKPFWFYFQGYSMGANYTFTPEMISTQMYCALAYGVKCLSYFSTIDCIADKTGNKLGNFDAIKAINRRVQNIGELLFDKTSEELYHFGIDPKNREPYFLDDPADSAWIADAPVGAIVGVFGDGSAKKCVLVANKDYRRPLTGELRLRRRCRIERYAQDTDILCPVADGADSVALHIPAGDAALFILS